MGLNHSTKIIANKQYDHNVYYFTYKLIESLNKQENKTESKYELTFIKEFDDLPVISHSLQKEYAILFKKDNIIYLNDYIGSEFTGENRELLLAEFAK
jgi:hypothetical protein